MDRLTVVISWALASLVVSRRIPQLSKPDMKTNKLPGILRVLCVALMTARPMKFVACAVGFPS
jgi:hypothetical protein